MGAKYIPNGNAKIVIGGATYQNEGEKIAVLPADKIGKEELERLLKMKLVKKLELKDGEGGDKNKAADKQKPAAKTEEDGLSPSNLEKKP